MTTKEYILINKALEKCRTEYKKGAKNAPIEVEIRKNKFYVLATDKGNSIIVAVKMINKTSYKQFELICDMLYKHYNCISIQKSVDLNSENIPKKLSKFELRKLIIIDKL